MNKKIIIVLCGGVAGAFLVAVILVVVYISHLAKIQQDFYTAAANLEKIAEAADMEKMPAAANAEKALKDPPLMEAVKNADEAAVRSLIASGADVNQVTRIGGKTALWMAAHEGNVALVNVLIGAGAKVDAETNGGTTALQEAAALMTDIGDNGAGHLASVKALIAAGANVQHRDGSAQTPLMDACLNSIPTGRVEIVRALIEAGADVNARENRGLTPLIFAAARGHEDVVKALLEAGADVNAADAEGRTALMLAASQGRTEVVKSLLAAGADVNAKYIHDGRTALDLAKNDEIRNLLSEAQKK